MYIYREREAPFKSRCLLDYDKRCERKGKSEEEEVRTIYMKEGGDSNERMNAC